MLNFTLNGIVILFIWILVVAVWTVEPVCVCVRTRACTRTRVSVCMFSFPQMFSLAAGLCCAYSA